MHTYTYACTDARTDNEKMKDGENANNKERKKYSLSRFRVRGVRDTWQDRRVTWLE